MSFLKFSGRAPILAFLNSGGFWTSVVTSLNHRSNIVQCPQVSDQLSRSQRKGLIVAHQVVDEF